MTAYFQASFWRLGWRPFQAGQPGSQKSAELSKQHGLLAPRCVCYYRQEGFPGDDRQHHLLCFWGQLAYKEEFVSADGCQLGSLYWASHCYSSHLYSGRSQPGWRGWLTGHHCRLMAQLWPQGRPSLAPLPAKKLVQLKQSTLGAGWNK